MNIPRLTFLMAGLSLCVAVPGHAAIVTVNGADVSFTFDDATLFGTGIAVGNSLFFQPTTFKAQSLNGAGVVSTSATLNITVTAITSGYVIQDVAMQELGDYQISGAGASVTAAGRLQVTSQTTLCGFFPCLDAQLFNATGLTTQGPLTNWSGGTNVDLNSIAGWGSDTNVIAQMQNNLTATTLAVGESAMIQKKFGGVGLIVNPVPVPVPAAVWFFGTGLLGLMGLAKRRKH